jgi:hypothetical protein
LRRARRLSLGLVTAALIGATGLASAAEAQTAPQGLRHLTWDGRPAGAASAPSNAPSPDARRRPNRVIPHGGVQAAQPAAAPSTAPRRTLTPATAWLQPAPAPAMAPPQPVPTAAPPAPVRATPEYLPDQSGRAQPVPAEVALPAPAAPAPTPAPAFASGPSADPMAPRRDAPIFRLQQTPQAEAPPAPVAAQPEAPVAAPAAAEPRPRQVAMVTANPTDRPALQGARRYSVHRQNGQAPDALALPEPTYIDALAVTMAETPASQDLAQPDQGPTLIRDAQGRMRAQPAAPEGDYQ